MPWNQVTAMEEKHRFVSLATTGKFTLTELCPYFKVSRNCPSFVNFVWGPIKAGRWLGSSVKSL